MPTLSIQFGALRQQRKFSKLNISTIYCLKIYSHNWVSILFGLGTQLQWSVLTMTWHHALQEHLHYLILKATDCFPSSTQGLFHTWLFCKSHRTQLATTRQGDSPIQCQSHWTSAPLPHHGPKSLCLCICHAIRAFIRIVVHNRALSPEDSLAWEPTHLDMVILHLPWMLSLAYQANTWWLQFFEIHCGHTKT